MSGVASIGSVNSLSLSTEKVAVQNKATVNIENKTIKLSTDSVSVSSKTESKEVFARPNIGKQSVGLQAAKGLIPGIVGGAIVGAGAGMLMGGASYVKTGLGAGIALGAITGAYTGPVVANITNKPGKGALVGVGTGIVGGAIFGLAVSKGNLGAALLGSAGGAIMGAGAGLSASFVGRK